MGYNSTDVAIWYTMTLIPNARVKNALSKGADRRHIQLKV